MWITIGKSILTNVPCFRNDISQVFVAIYSLYPVLVKVEFGVFFVPNNI